MSEQSPHSACRSLVSLISVLLVLVVGLVPGASCTSGGDPGPEPIPEAKDQDIGSLGVAGYAKLLCSSVFVSEMEDAVAIEHTRRVTRALVRLPAEDMAQVTESIDHENRLVRATLRGALTRTAKLYGDQGCIIHPEDHDGIYFDPVPVRTSLPDAKTLPWPMGDLLPDDPLPPEVDEAKLRAAVEVAFEPPSRTAGLVVVYKDRLVAERYAEGITKDTLLESWSSSVSAT